MRWRIEDAALGPVTADAAMEARLAARFAALAGEPLIRLLDGTDDLEEARALVRAWRRKSDVTVVIGTGGASLGAQTLVAMAPGRERVRFLDNIDPDSLTRLLDTQELTRVSWLVVSKSGGTVETLATLLAVQGAYAQAGMASEFAARAAAITGPGESPLRHIATTAGIPIFMHPPVGGRYSVFTLVGLLPAEIAGLDAAALRQGAVQWFAHARSDGTAQLFRHAAWFAQTMQRKPVHVVMPYDDRLRAYTRWFQQLWAESLGKGGQGSTPFAALGTIDQHSQLQMFLDGPRDKSFTLVLPCRAGLGPRLAAAGALAFLDGHCIGDVMDASAQAIATTLATHGVPLRILRTQALDAGAMGELLLRHMVETVLVAAWLDIDPYDQPAVEEGKKLTRHYLENAPRCPS